MKNSCICNLEWGIFQLLKITKNKITNSIFFLSSRCDYSQYAPQLIRAFIMLFTSKDEVILQQAWNALAAVTKNMDADEQVRPVLGFIEL